MRMNWIGKEKKSAKNSLKDENEWKFIRAYNVTQVVKKHKKVYHTSLQTQEEETNSNKFNFFVVEIRKPILFFKSKENSKDFESG